jgi:ABC-2 type transport system permease protein
VSAAKAQAKKTARVEPEGTIRDRGYTPYAGVYTPPGRRWSLIARRMLRLQMPQWWVILILVGALLRLLIGGAALWFRAKVSAMAQQGVPMGGPEVSIVGVLVDATGTMLLAFLLALFAGGGAVADDARAGAFQFYFARPVTKAQYLVGKLVPLLTMVGFVTIVPGVLLALLRLALLPTASEVAHNLYLLPAALDVGVLEALALATPALAISASSRRRGYVQGAYATAFLLPWILGGIFVRVTRSPWPALLSIPAHLDSVAHWLFRIPPALEDPPLLPHWLSLGVLVAIAAVSLAYLRRQLDAVEVVAG